MQHIDPCDGAIPRPSAPHGGRSLPDRQPDRVWGGQGSGEPCAVCRRRIDPTEAEIELEFVATPPACFVLHPRCFRLWEAEHGTGAASAGTPLTEAGSRRKLTGGDRGIA